MKRQISAEVIADSLNTATGDQLTTFRVTCPKFLLQEINTHRSLSKSFSSMRAVPPKKTRKQVLEDPFVPTYWGKNQAGMQAKEPLKGLKLVLAKRVWLWSRYPVCLFHWLGEKVGLHKQLLNRIIEPWIWAEGVISGTEWKNFFGLRDHHLAQPEFAELAFKMHEAKRNSIPNRVHPGFWHLPFIDPAEYAEIVNHTPSEGRQHAKMVSAARCARVSYYLRDGKRSTLDKDIQLCERLVGESPRHMGPLEHQAVALPTRERIGNFVGWKQHRKEFADEAMGDYEGLENTVLL